MTKTKKPQELRYCKTCSDYRYFISGKRARYGKAKALLCTICLAEP